MELGWRCLVDTGEGSDVVYLTSKMRGKGLIERGSGSGVRRREEREKDFGFCSGFQILNLYSFRIFGSQLRYYIIWIVLSIFSK